MDWRAAIASHLDIAADGRHQVVIHPANCEQWIFALDLFTCWLVRGPVNARLEQPSGNPTITFEVFEACV